MSMRCNFNEIGSDGVVDELIVFGDEFVEAFLNHLGEELAGVAGVTAVGVKGGLRMGGMCFE